MVGAIDPDPFHGRIQAPDPFHRLKPGSRSLLRLSQDPDPYHG